MIKTIVAGDALERALDRQQEWFDRHVVVDERAAFNTRDVIDRMTAAPGRRRALRLRMAKADLHPESR